MSDDLIPALHSRVNDLYGEHIMTQDLIIAAREEIERLRFEVQQCKEDAQEFYDGRKAAVAYAEELAKNDREAFWLILNWVSNVGGECTPHDAIDGIRDIARDRYAALKDNSRNGGFDSRSLAEGRCGKAGSNPAESAQADELDGSRGLTAGKDRQPSDVHQPYPPPTRCFKASKDGRCLYDEGHIADVRLDIDGDWEHGDAERIAYAHALVAKLNAELPEIGKDVTARLAEAGRAMLAEQPQDKAWWTAPMRRMQAALDAFHSTYPQLVCRFCGDSVASEGVTEDAGKTWAHLACLQHAKKCGYVTRTHRG
jgi:hypothetical protein